MHSQTTCNSMSFEPTATTKKFIRQVKTLLEKGEVKNQKEIIDSLKWDKTVFSNVMNGRKNIPNDVYRRFTEVYHLQGHVDKEDIREQQIELLRDQNQFLREQMADMSRRIDASLKMIENNQLTIMARLSLVEDGMRGAKNNQRVMYALQVEFQNYVLENGSWNNQKGDARKIVSGKAAAYLKKLQQEDIQL